MEDNKLIRLIQQEHRETYGTYRLRTRNKRCHEIAAKAIESAPEGTLLVQGIESDREHSWLELPDGRTWDGVTCEFDLMKPQSIARKYTKTEVFRKIIDTGFYGWWS